MLDKFCHGPSKQDRSAFCVVRKAIFELFSGWRLADPDVLLIRWTQSVAKSADNIRHRAPSANVARRKPLQFGLTLLVVVIELNARAVFERDEQPIGGWCPRITALG